MRLRPPWLLLLLLVPWLALGASNPWACGQPPSPPSCLDSATSVQVVAGGTRSVSFGVAGRAADGTGGTWSGLLSDALTLTGPEHACWVGGTIDGPAVPDSEIYYECSSTHGYTGGPCFAYHTTAGIAPDDPAGHVIEDVAVGGYGDGLSIPPSGDAGDVLGRRLYLHDLHDDALESDWAQQSLGCEDCLFERVFMGLAYNRRSSASGNTPRPGVTMTLRDSLVQLHRFVHSYKEKSGHGGIFKDDDGFAPDFIVTRNTFLMGPVAGSGQVQFPMLGHVRECEGNVLLWQGTESAFDSMLATGSAFDGATNGERLAALAHCYEVRVKPAGQSAADFRAEHWDPLVSAWKAAHAAGGS